MEGCILLQVVIRCHKLWAWFNPNYAQSWERGGKAAFDSSQLFADALNARPVYIPNWLLWSSISQLEGQQKENQSTQIAVSIQAQTKVLALGKPTFLPCLAEDGYMLWGWLQEQSRRKTCVCFSVILKNQIKILIFKNKSLPFNLFSFFWKAQS